ncbi:MAG: DUF1684 domain-containing protein [Cyclobacteriaceae bacterium]
MKKIGFLAAIVLVFLAFYTFYKGGNSESYKQQVENTIDERVKYLRTSESSPFNKTDLVFSKPKYFDVNPEYRVNAKLDRITTRERVIISNSDGTQASYQKFAFANFRLNNKDCQLLILKPTGLGAIQQYFLGFADDTSGETTYGGGRYIDVEIGKSNKIVLDFNLAYNPYCAYGEGFTCPLPPKENVLPLAIEAGEKKFDP